MKESTAIKNSLSLTPLFSFGMLSVVYFTYTLLTALFSNMNTSVCWEAGILVKAVDGRKFTECFNRLYPFVYNFD